MGISRELFELIRKNHGEYGSWAVWNEPRKGDKRLSGGMNEPIFDNVTDELLSHLKPQYMFIGYNWSTGSVAELMNFHSVDSHIGKLRYALRNSPFWGAYLTDVVKYYSNPDSKKAEEYLADHPEIEADSIAILRKEISDLGVEQPILIAFGRRAFKTLNKHLKGEYKIVQITHYSHQIERPADENYKNKIMKKLVAELNCGEW